MSDTKKLVEKLNESIKNPTVESYDVTDEKFQEIIYTTWRNYVGEEVDKDKLTDLEAKFLDEIAEIIDENRMVDYQNGLEK